MRRRRATSRSADAPRSIRRPLTITTWLIVSALAVLASPVLLPIAIVFWSAG